MLARVPERERQLADQLEEAREEIRQLRALLVPEIPLPAAWRLSPSEATFFRHLMSRDLATRESTLAALYGDRIEQPEPEILRVHLTRLRAKVPGVEIRTHYQVGWSLVDRARWLETLEGPMTNAGGMITVPIKISAKAHQKLHEQARAAGYRGAQEYGQLLFDAAYAARVENLRGLPASDAELDALVRLTFVSAGGLDVAATAKALNVPEAFVEKVRDGWRQASQTQARKGKPA